MYSMTLVRSSWCGLLHSLSDGYQWQHCWSLTRASDRCQTDSRRNFLLALKSALADFQVLPFNSPDKIDYRELLTSAATGVRPIRTLAAGHVSVRYAEQSGRISRPGNSTQIVTCCCKFIQVDQLKQRTSPVDIVTACRTRSISPGR